MFCLLLIIASIINIFCGSEDVPIVDIIITVKTELHILRPCIASILSNQPNREILEQRVIFVDDGSPSDTVSFMEGLCKSKPTLFLCESTVSKQSGYTYAVNAGIQLAERLGKPPSDSIVLLNSDTMVTENWLVELHEALFGSDPNIALVGPVSNAASYQSIPVVKDPINFAQYWDTNPPPAGMDINFYARELEHFVSQNSLDNVPLKILNGFCFMFKRLIIEKIGLFDTEHFRKGYGEEVDFSIRANRAGFKAVVVPSVFVYHKKTASFSDAEKQSLKAIARKFLDETYSNEIGDFGKEAEFGPTLSTLRNYAHGLYHQTAMRFPFIQRKYTKKLPQSASTIAATRHAVDGVTLSNVPSILFVCHSLEPNGVTQGLIGTLTEALRMLRDGALVAVALPIGVSSTGPDDAIGKGEEYIGNLVRTWLPDITPAELQSLILPYSGSITYPDQISEDFAQKAQIFDVLVAIYSLTVPAIRSIVQKSPHIMPAFYVQDYDPWFWKSPFESKSSAGVSSNSDSGSRDLFGPIGPFDPKAGEYMEQALKSLEDSSGDTFYLVKTKWLERMIAANNTAPVRKIVPSLDHNMYYPDRTDLARRLKNGSSSSFSSSSSSFPSQHFSIVGIVRLSAPQLNAVNTVEVLLRLAFKYPDKVTAIFVGCKENELKKVLDTVVAEFGPAPHRNIDLLLKGPNTKLIGNIEESNGGLADLFRSVDIFIDLSWWQAFGRAGIEAMACGVISIMPLTGAAPEICREDLEFCQYHDGMDPDGVVDKVVALIGNDSMRHDLIRKGMQRSRHFSVDWAAASILEEIYKGLIHYRRKYPV